MHYLIGATIGWVAAMLLLLVYPTQSAETSKPLNPGAEPLVLMVLQEAANEPFAGMVAVAAVALDRVKDTRWPSTLRRVLYQPAQFEGLSKPTGNFNAGQIRRARTAATVARKGARPCGKVFWYHNTSVKPWWRRNLKVRCRIGLHIFYEDK